MKTLVAAVVISFAFSGAALAQTCSSSSYPYTLTNGNTADASQLMANFSCAARVYSPSFSGNVGIGVTTPTVALDVKSGSSNQVLRLTGPSSNTQLEWASPASGGLWSLGPDIQYGGSSNDFELYNWGNGGGTAGTKLTILGSGNVGIGTASPAYTLQVNGSAAGMSAWVNLSDGRLKTNIDPVTDGLSVIGQLRPVRFNWLSPAARPFGKELVLPADNRQVGFIAQEVQTIAPEAVLQGTANSYSSTSFTYSATSTPPTSPSVTTTQVTYYGLKEGDLVPFLVSAVQQQQAMITALQARVSALEALQSH